MNASFRATYLGWQSWCLETPTTRILIDPLLLDEMGRGAPGTRMSFIFRQGRSFDFSRLGPVDAILLTHEHEDHFNIPSLARCDREIPLVVSGLISNAARAILHDMGFHASYPLPGDCLTIGDLQLAFLGPDHLWAGAPRGDEWDTMAYSVRHTTSAACFFSNVDTPVTPSMSQHIEAERRHGARVISFHQMQVGLDLAMDTCTERNAHRSATPASGDCARDREELHAGRAFTPFVGETIDLLECGEWDVGKSPFVRGAGINERAEPFFVAREQGNISPPVTGETAFAAHRRPELESELRIFAEYLYARPLFRALCSLDRRFEGRGRTMLLSFSVDGSGATWAYEYQPAACDFVPVNLTGPSDGYLGRLRLWATDFMAVAQGELEPRAIRRGMDVDERDEGPSLLWEFWTAYHPLRFPSRVLRQYRSVYATEQGADVSVRAGR